MDIEERGMNKRIQIVPKVSTVVNGQPFVEDGVAVTRWAHMYQKIGKESDVNGRQTGNDRIHWTLRKDSTLFDITGVVKYDGREWDITSVRELNSWQMQIICNVSF